MKYFALAAVAAATGTTKPGTQADSFAFSATQAVLGASATGCASSSDVNTACTIAAADDGWCCTWTDASSTDAQWCVLKA